MKCPRCQVENDAAARFCEDCGARLEAACPRCGTPVTPGKKFCRSCGAALTAEPAGRFASPDSYTPKHLAERILTSKAALEGERKQVTVLFADLKGSMELLADRDPEEARKILDPVLELMMEAVHRYEGTVNQVMGDGIMALFGAPIAHEDHAARACYAALRMQEALQRYGEESRRAVGLPVSVRVGLNSGEVVVRSVGSDLRMDYTAVGQTVHLAARMEQAAMPGSILISANTLRMAEGLVAVRSVGSIPIKGLADPVEAYVLTGVGQARTRLQAAAIRGLTRFVGRDAEIEHLSRLLGLAAASHGQVAAVVGEAGVGKSRLVSEFTHFHRVQECLVLEAASVSYGKATGYLPVIELLKSYFQIGDRDHHREMRDKVLGRLLRLDRALEPLLAPLLALLDVPVEDPSWKNFDPSQRRQRTLDAVKRLLLRESQVQPLLVVFEDLHWIDGESQALLDSLVESLGSASLLLLVSYRPEYEHRWGGKTYYSQLRLDTLPVESTAELLGALLGPDQGLDLLKQMLLKRGNPFFLEETVRALAETGDLVGDRGAYRLTRPVQALQVPPTVQTILAARIDRLPAEEKQLLQTASVVGKDVAYAILATIAEQPEEGLRLGLTHLQEAEFLYETRVFPDREYTFKHALTHEVAYGTLLQTRRQALHARIVEVTERLYADRMPEHLDLLSHHASRGEVWEKAVLYLRQAGEKALVRSANREAAAYFSQALVAMQNLREVPDLPRHVIDLRFRLNRALGAIADFVPQFENLEEARRMAEMLPDERRLAMAYSYLVEASLVAGAHSRVMEMGERALALATASGDPRVESIATFALGFACHQLGDYRRAVEYQQRATDLADRTSLRVPVGRQIIPGVFSRIYLAFGLADLGRFPDAHIAAEEASRLADAAHSLYTQAFAAYGVGVVSLRKGDDLAQAIRPLEHGVKVCLETDNHILFPHVAATLGSLYARCGRDTEGVALLTQALDAAVLKDVMAARSWILTRLAEAHLDARRLTDAYKIAERAHELARRQRERGFEAWALTILAEVEAQQEARTAVGRFTTAADLGTELGMRPLVAHCHLGLGKLCRRTGKPEQAREHLTTATTMYREMDMRFWLEKAETEMKELA